eukprot:scaffold26003_cov18-Prasinocladus_malaysianus.AAC.1
MSETSFCTAIFNSSGGGHHTDVNVLVELCRPAQSVKSSDQTKVLTVGSVVAQVYQLKNGELQNVVIELEAPCVGLLRNGRSFLIGCMNNIIHQYQMKVGWLADGIGFACVSRDVICDESSSTWLVSTVLYASKSQGKKTYSIYLPAPLLAMEAMKISKKQSLIYAVALSNGKPPPLLSNVFYSKSHLAGRHTSVVSS